MSHCVRPGRLIAAVIACGAVAAALPAAAEEFNYTTTLKGTLTNANGVTRKFRTTGTLRIDDQTLHASGEFDLGGVTGLGGGEGVFGTKYLLLNLDLEKSMGSGRLLIQTRFNRDKSKLIKGKLAFVGSDGTPPPAGTVYVIGTLTGVRVQQSASPVN